MRESDVGARDRGVVGERTLRQEMIRYQGTPQAGAPKHRQRFLSVRPGGWCRTPVHCSGTRLTLALRGGLGLGLTQILAIFS